MQIISFIIKFLKAFERFIIFTTIYFHIYSLLALSTVNFVHSEQNWSHTDCSVGTWSILPFQSLVDSGYKYHNHLLYSFFIVNFITHAISLLPTKRMLRRDITEKNAESKGSYEILKQNKRNIWKGFQMYIKRNIMFGTRWVLVNLYNKQSKMIFKQ